MGLAMVLPRQIALAICLLLLAPPLCASQNVVYSWSKSMLIDQRGHYPIALLELALEKSGEHYLAMPSKKAMTQYRTLRQLELGEGVDIVWTMTSPEREERLLPIRIPIDRGLIGWRLLLIQQEQQQRIAEHLSSGQLHKLLAVQGEDWPDFTILRANHYRVTGTFNFDGMFQMLANKRVDYFPRSITEIRPELAARPQLKLQTEAQWVLHYPAALYFFVRKNNKELAKAIESGLNKAIEDGSMVRLFLQHFGDDIQYSRLKNRKVISLSNPTLPEATPIERKELWFDLSRGY